MTNSLNRFVLDNDLVICRNELGHWGVEGVGFSFPLTDAPDFKRVITLLETPIDNVRLALGADFSYMCVVEAGLRHNSDYWIGLALSWISDTSAQEAYAVIDDLKVLSRDRVISQKNRQQARKELRRLVRYGSRGQSC